MDMFYLWGLPVGLYMEEFSECEKFEHTRVLCEREFRVLEDLKGNIFIYLLDSYKEEVQPDVENYDFM